MVLPPYKKILCAARTLLLSEIWPIDGVLLAAVRNTNRDFPIAYFKKNS